MLPCGLGIHSSRLFSLGCLSRQQTCFDWSCFGPERPCGLLASGRVGSGCLALAAAALSLGRRRAQARGSGISLDQSLVPPMACL